MKKKWMILTGVAVVIIAGTAIFFVQRNNVDEGQMKLSGNVEVTETNVGFKIPGRVIEILTDEGHAVKKGDALAKLDSAEMKALYDRARAGLDEATVRLLELKSGLRPQEVERAKANVILSKAELDKAGKDYERAQILYENGAISASQYDAAKSAFEARAAMNKNALEALSLAREGARKEDIKAAEYQAEQAKAALAAAEERFKDTVIYAPITGVVLRKNVELGETVGAGVPVFTIGDLENPWIKVYVREGKLGLVKLGQKARITTDSYPDKSYEGTVTYIASEAEFTPKSVQTEEERVKLVYGVKVKAKNVNSELKPGMPADVYIILRDRKG